MNDVPYRRIRLLLIGMGLISIVRADVRETIGYGSGDDLVQAVTAAKVDAVLNAGGRASVVAEAKQDRLVRDEGKIENEACLISYEVTEKGESFDGTYVRIKAKISKGEDYVLKDGTTEVRGEGSGKDEREAMVMALCNAIVESGSKINAVVKCEGDQLVADDAQMTAHGVLVSYVGEKPPGGTNIIVKCKIHANAEGLTELLPIRVVGNGTGKNAAFAAEEARRNMVLNWGTEFFVRAKYKDGLPQSFIAERKCDAFISASRIPCGGKSGSAGGEARLEGMRYKSESDLHLAERKSMEGVGYGVDFIEARRAAFCNALVNLGTHVTMTVVYEKGRQTKEDATYRSSYNYFGENSTTHRSLDGGCLVTTTVLAGGKLPFVHPQISDVVEAIGYGKGKLEAVRDAKQRAVDSVFGCPMEVCVSERNGRIVEVSYTPTHSTQGYIAKHELLLIEEGNGGVIVKIRAVVKNHEGDATGWSWIVATIVIFVMGAVFAGARKTMGVAGLTIVWIATAVGLFATGHWAVGIGSILMGIGATKAD